MKPPVLTVDDARDRRMPTSVEDGWRESSALRVPDIIRVPSALGTSNTDGQCGPCNSDCTQDGSSGPRSPLSWFVIPRTHGNNLGLCS